jgi:hypothetical protein
LRFLQLAQVMWVKNFSLKKKTWDWRVITDWIQD